MPALSSVAVARSATRLSGAIKIVWRWSPVRQSTAQQVERHQESTRLQYALADRAAQFGWLRERIVVIDDDLGTAVPAQASRDGRLGLQRLVAEVGLGKVGLVLGVEMSRLARSCPGTGISFWRSARSSTR